MATELPSNRIEPTEALAELRQFWPELDRLDQASAGLGTRYTCEPLPRLLRTRGLTRLRADYLEHARELARAAAVRALARADLKGSDVDLIVTVSCTGYLVPSLDVHLAPLLGLRPDVIRVPLTELGCSGGAAGLALASRHLLAFPDQVALVLAVELPSLSFQASDRSLDNLTASLVFGDGAGAAVLSGRSDRPGGRLEVKRSASHLVPGSAHLLGFDLLDEGFKVVLDRRLARVIRAELPRVLDRFRASDDLHESQFFVAHAGGLRILDAVEAALELPRSVLELSREVFGSVGNTSSASIFFALERLMASLGDEPRQGWGISLGPGVSIELMQLAWIA
ncbi:MAG TPA: type III polyketide synthase [Candidatus Nitrosotalea sp.]|nr:type III polyketide synthase [Candidatus Nitrosotalea sp.]